MSDVSEIIDEFSQALEDSRATLAAEQLFTRKVTSIPLRGHRKSTDYEALSDQELPEHKKSLLEGIFHDYTTNKVRGSMSAKISDVKTEAFLGDSRITGVTVYLPKPILTILGTEKYSDYESAKVYHHRMIDNTLRTALSRQATQFLDVGKYPYANVDQWADGLATDLATEFLHLPSTVSAKESWVTSASASDVDDILKVYDRRNATANPLYRENQRLGDVLAEVEGPARAMSLEFIESWTEEKRTDLHDEIVKSIKKEQLDLDPTQVDVQARELRYNLIMAQWSEEEQHQKALDKLSAYFERHPPSADYASSVDLFPIVFGHNLKDDATDLERATDPNGIKTVLTTGGEGDWTLASFLPPPFSELLSDSQE
jgi:hypothetical protein